MARSPELVAFNKCTAVMENCLNPDDITGQLFSQGMITCRERESVNSKSNRYEKASALISAVSRHLELQPEDFSQFLRIIDREPAFSGVSKRLRGNETGICASIC